MQRAVVQRIQDKDAGRLAEEETSLVFREFLASKGLSEEVVEASVLRLSDWSCFVVAVPTSEVDPRELLSRPDKRRKEQNTRSEILGENPRERRNVLRSECPPGFNVCESNKRRVRVLHLLGACYNVPGVDYFVYEHVGLDMPNESAYDSVCTLCSRKGVTAVAADSDRSLGSSSSDPEE